MSAGPAPGYCTLTATSRPSRHTARWTWPMLAAAAGRSSKLVNCCRQVAPSSAASTLCTVAVGSGGAASCSLVSTAR